MNKTARNIFKFISVLILLGVIGFIWRNSSEEADASSAKSTEITDTVNEVLFDERPVVSEHFVRKTAHFSEYALEGLAIVLIVTSFFVIPKKKQFFIFYLIAVVTAMCDELIQRIPVGRSAQVSDVCLDCVGAAFGMLIGVLVYRGFYKRGMKHNK